MLALFLLLVLVAMVLGIVGVVVHGLLYLLIIGIVVFLGALTLGALRMRRRPGRAPGTVNPREPAGTTVHTRTAAHESLRADRKRILGASP
jgi:hypothetical protein